MRFGQTSHPILLLMTGFFFFLMSELEPKKECCWSPRWAGPGRGEKVFITVAIMFSYINEAKENGALAQRFGRPTTAIPPAIINSFPCISPRVCAKATELILEVVVTPFYAGAKHVEIISVKGKVCRSDGTPKKKSFLEFPRHVYPNKAVSRIM